MKLSFFKIAFPLLFISFFAIGCKKKSNENEKPLDTSVSIYLVTNMDSSNPGIDVGCGDMLVEVKEDAVVERSLLEAAIGKLLEIKSENNLRNYIKGPGLLLYQVTIARGIADVYLKGDFNISELCDLDRIEKQLKETAKLYPRINQTNFYINDQTLDQYLSIQRKSF